MIFLMLILIPEIGLSCEFKIGVREYPPYTYQNADKSWAGIDIDMFNYLVDEIGCDKKYIRINFGQALKLLKDGKIDALAQMSKIEQRLNTVHFVGPTRSETLTLIVSKKVPETINHFSDIANHPYIFAKREGTFIGHEFNKLMQSNIHFSSKFIETNTETPRINLVLKGRVVGFFDDIKFNQYMLKNSPQYQNMKMHPLKIDNGLIYFGFSKKTVSQYHIEKLRNVF